MREYKLTAQQTYARCMLLSCFGIMIVCCIARRLGILWFAADVTLDINISEFWQNRIMNVLLIFELTFTYLILCRCKSIVAFLIAVLHTVVLFFIPVGAATTIYNFVLMFVIPLIFTRNYKTLLDSLFLIGLVICYSGLFLVGRIGDMENASYSFIYAVLGAVDYKMLFPCIYYYVLNFGGIKLWKLNLLTRTDQKQK